MVVSKVLHADPLLNFQPALPCDTMLPTRGGIMDETARLRLFKIVSCIAFMAIDTSQKTDAADEVLRQYPTLQKPYLDTLEKMKHRGQYTEISLMLQDLHKTLGLTSPLSDELLGHVT
jgi:hypothetical protein